MDIRRILPVLAIAGGCINATFHAKTAASLPPIADHAVVTGDGDAAAIAERGDLVGTIDTSGNGASDQHDLADRAATIAANHGGTHVVTTTAGVTTSTYTSPASQTTTCTDNSDASTCTTTYTPETTTTTTTPYATYDVYRVAAERWFELPGGLRPETYDPSHHAPTQADGWGVTLGGFSAPYPGPTSGTNGSVFPTAYSSSVAQLEGGWLATSFERGSTVVAVDMRVGGGSFDGTATSARMATHYTGTYFGTSLALRAGKRIAWQDVALAAGSGIGGGMWMTSTMTDTPAFVETPSGASGDFYVPVWASLTIKPTCSVGVQGLAEYDLRPQDSAASSPSLSLGLIWQPASACD
jgi:hypothetical protein